MDAWEATKVVFDRVRALDPENASKMMGLLLIQDNSDKELIRLAFGPEHLLHSFVATARAELAAKPASPPSPVLGPLQSGAPWGLPSPGSGAGGGGGGDHHHHSPFAAADQLGYDGGADAFYADEYDCWSPAGAAGAHRRSFSLSDAEAAASWRPCMYYARGYCKNGSSCRFLHGVPEDDAAEREMAVMRAKALAAAPPTQQQQLMASAYPFSPSPKGGVSLSFLLQQQQQSETQRAAAGMLLGGEDMHRFPVRSPRMDRGDLIGSPAARQIYLTFPADSTFSEEDVSNYFSMFGPVQDVRIPYQQKRMFGFVTFVYAETVKAILSKGNPHFVCDARVLVKPYKEKGKVPDRFRKLQHTHHGGAEFVGCASPTGLLDSRDPYDLQQPQIGSRMMYGNIANQHEAFLRRKLEEEQAAELQQAIELEGRRFMGLQLLDLKSRGHHHLGSGAPMPLRQATDGKGSGINGNGNASHLEDAICIQDKRMMSSLAMSAPAAADAEGEHEEQQEEGGGGCDGSSSSSPKQAVNPGEEEVVESGPVTATPNAACGFQESYGVVEVELVLPDSPFASPTKEEASYADAVTTAAARNGSISSSPRHVALFAPASSTTLELPPYSSSSFFQVPRFSRGHEAIGL
ncbi:zinc finger CCCH domain-containing protein 53 isoform X2 [Zea mays]|uniref:zinc finger CCCH domain-containing protein 53 isoform X2 n=1 Tax=Zea mays TaxID=4577 RepID=UPI0004DEBD6B|nr:zinc finger CCCH domain-containing protein 53 isoform X2 [Zea mays]|eukprot:XP_008679357.1 zinc finger CCCH domain-containing protein 53 isoform X2 [Zea mays]